MKAVNVTLVASDVCVTEDDGVMVNISAEIELPSGGLEKDIVVHVMTEEGTATTGPQGKQHSVKLTIYYSKFSADYQIIIHEMYITFSSGTSSMDAKTAETIIVINDEIVESDEYLFARIFTADSAVVLPHDSITIVIKDDSDSKFNLLTS